jgi:putative peptidoglycan lipid II flippase
MTRIMFPYIVFMSFVALAAAFEHLARIQGSGFHARAAQFEFIAAALFVAPCMDQPVYALASRCWSAASCNGHTDSGADAIGMLPRIHSHCDSPVGCRRAAGMRQMVPATFAVSVAQISLIINTNIASHLRSGSVSWLSYADR